MHGVELWRSDGTAAGTTLVKDIDPGTGNSHPSNMVVIGDRVFFVASDEPTLKKLALYKSWGQNAAGDIVRLV